MSSVIPERAADLLTPSEQYTVLVSYLRLKVQSKDWHGVCDAAMDIRELVAKHPDIKEA